MNTIGWWDPSGELAQTHRMMDRLFEGFFGPGGTNPPDGKEAPPTYFMPVDILETEDAYILQGAVPGFSPDRVEVTFDDGILSIQAAADPVQVNGQWLRRERPRGSLVRKLELPAEVQAEKIVAAFDNGILTITVPKAPRSQPVRIPVSGNGSRKLTGVRG